MQILIVDDHTLFAEGLRLLLLGSTEGDQIVCCQTGAKALELAELTPFELVLLDWNLGSGVSGEAVIEALKDKLPLARVVVVSGESSAEIVRRAIEGGAAGFLPKESSPTLLVDALTIIAHGGVYLPIEILGKSHSGDAKPAQQPDSQALRSLTETFPQLTPRQVDVLDRLARGMSNKQIARALAISDGTVKQHLNVVFRELDVASRSEAVYLMAKRGLRFN